MTVPGHNSRWRGLAKAGIALAFLATCAWWALLILGPERFFLAGAYLYLPYWLVLLPLIVVPGIAWPLGWRWRAPAFAALLIFLWPIMGFNVAQPGGEHARHNSRSNSGRHGLVAVEMWNVRFHCSRPESE